jgi:oryzin
MKSFVYIALFLLSLTSALPLEGAPAAGETVPEKYIIILKPGVKAPEISGHVNWVEKVHKRNIEAQGLDDLLKLLMGKNKGKGKKKHRGVEKVWKGNFKGYSGEFDKDTIAQIAENDDVSTIDAIALYIC